jgi:hypothetical protein
MKMLVVAMALLTGLLGAAVAEEENLTEMTLRQLGKAADCTDKDSPWRPWCIGTEWSKGKLEAPKGTLVGISVELPTGKTDHQPHKDALTNKVGLVAFAVSGDKVKLIDIKPTAKGEDVMMAKAVANLSAVFKTKAKTAAIEKELTAYIKSLKGTYPTTKGTSGLTWKGANVGQLRKVGKFWVAIELSPKGDAMWVSILTDAYQ